MRISINSPSYKRAGAVGTFKLLPGAWFWVHEFEADDYKKANKRIKIKILPDALRGNVAKVRNHILKAQISKANVTVMVDDDMKSVGYFHNRKKVFLKDEHEIRLMIGKYTRLAKEFGVLLWGINVSPDKQNYREYTPFSMTSYISASFSCFLRGNKILYDERFPLKEDYDMTIQQCNIHRRVLRVNRYFYDKKGAEQSGGCAAYRNVAVEMDQIRLLQKKWGSRIVSHDFNTRSHSSIKKRNFDINPVIKIPIRGV
jgi:hypothetical protein